MEFIRKIKDRCACFIKKHKIVLLSFFLPVLILEIAYITREIYPFGGRNVLLIDLFHQYAPFLSELQDRFRSFSGLLYTWSGGLGTNYLPLYAYYLASPLNILSIFFPKGCLTELVLFLILLRTGLSGAFFASYLKSTRGEKGGISIAAFSTMYALSGFMLAYSWNIMWIDAVCLLPLIALGLIKIVRGGNGFFYCITLSTMLFSSFYMSVFICLFLILYFPICLLQYNSIRQPKIVLKRICSFSLYSLLAGGLASVLLVPTYYALKLTSAVGEALPSTFKQYFDMFDYLSRHFVIVSPAIREGMPNLYCGIAVLILIPLYFFSKSINLKEKFLYLSILIVLFISFNTDTLNFLWHGGHFPNQLPYRYSFLYVFIVLTLAYTAFTRLHEFEGINIGIISLIAAGIVILSQKLIKEPPEHYILYVSIVFIAIYAACLTVDRHKQGFVKAAKKPFVFLIIVSIEILLNTIVTIGVIDSTEYYSVREGYSGGREVSDIRKQLKELEKADESFYRAEVFPAKTTNDPFLYNYRGLSIFSSTIPEKPVWLMENLGFHSNSINSYKYEGSTILLDSLLGIKYIIKRDDAVDEKLYNLVGTTDEIKTYENPFALPPGFIAPADIVDWKSYSGNPFNTQNTLVNRICGVSDILTPLKQAQEEGSNLTFSSTGTNYYSYKKGNPSSKATAKVNIDIEKSGYVYLYLDISGDSVDNGFVMVNDKKVDFNARRSTLANVGFCELGDKIQFELTFKDSAPQTGNFKLLSYTVDQAKLVEAIGLIKENSMEVSSFSDNRISGFANAEKDSIMVMTIPFDPGWQVKIDGERSETMALDEGFLCFDLPAGEHKIELIFIPDKMNLGLIISLVSIVILFILYRYKRKHPGRMEPEHDMEFDKKSDVEFGSEQDVRSDVEFGSEQDVKSDVESDFGQDKKPNEEPSSEQDKESDEESDLEEEKKPIIDSDLG